MQSSLPVFDIGPEPSKLSLSESDLATESLAELNKLRSEVEKVKNELKSKENELESLKTSDKLSVTKLFKLSISFFLQQNPFSNNS